MLYINSNLYLSPRKFDFRNTLTEGQVIYRLEHLSKKSNKSKGGNSSVFKLIDPNSQNEFAIKFLKFPANSSNPYHIKQNIRFSNEINALEEAKNRGFNNVIEIIFNGEKKVGKYYFNFYVMEMARYDLTNFLKVKSLAINQKLLLSYQIVEGLMQLHSMNLYHRDIKPDNIFVMFYEGKAIWKIGDLGLSARRDQDLGVSEFQEKIGPYGWLSPEVTNKVLCEGTILDGVFDCKIDEKSDVFQLGKLLWFIFQGNIPIGQIRFSDFLPKDKRIFLLIKDMLQYRKSRRKELVEYASILYKYTA